MHLTIVAALRVKNEARWIGEVLESVSFCKKTYLMDDHSTDGTADIARHCGAEVLSSPFQGLDEARDKEWLTRIIALQQPRDAWVLMIDGDEVLIAGGRELIEAAIAEHPQMLAFSLKIIYLWNSRNEIRVDGVYSRFTRPSLFKIDQPLIFRRTPQSGHLHCSSVPAYSLGKSGTCPAALLHLGYMNREDRIRKWEYYNSIDPRNKAEGYDPDHPERGSYAHIVQGDIPEVPADAALMHAGPLKLQQLEAENGIL